MRCSRSSVRAGTASRGLPAAARRCADVDRFAEPDHRPARAAGGDLGDAQEVFLVLHQRLGHALERRALVKVVARVAEGLEGDEGVVQVATAGRWWLRA